MTGERRPLLAFGSPTVVDRPTQTPRDMPRLSKPNAGRQGERLTPQFGELTAAFDAERARLSADTPDEVDPALVVVFDLAGSIKDFRNAIDQIDGLEFLSELIGDRSDPDDDFHMTESDSGRTDKPVQHSLYLMMSNAKRSTNSCACSTPGEQTRQRRSPTAWASSRPRSSSSLRSDVGDPRIASERPACVSSGRRTSTSSVSLSAP